MIKMTTHQNALAAQLKALHLSGIAETLDVRLSQASDERWAFSELLTRLFADEKVARCGAIERRDQLLLQTRIRRANIVPDKTKVALRGAIDQFDFSFNPILNQPLIMELATCQGPPSVGGSSRRKSRSSSSARPVLGRPI